MKNIRIFHLKFFLLFIYLFIFYLFIFFIYFFFFFVIVKFPMYLNRRVFVMLFISHLPLLVFRDGGLCIVLSGYLYLYLYFFIVEYKIK